MDAMIAADARGWLTAAAVNLVMSARDDPSTMRAVLGATLAVPDGQPLVWALRLLGHARATRVYGPDLMAHYCAHAASTGTPIYLYGGRSEQALARLGRRDAARVADQKPQSQPGFKVPNDAAEGWLRHAELRCSPRKAPLPRDRQEGDQVVHGLPSHLCVQVISP